LIIFFRLIRVEYNLDKKDFLSFVLEILPIDLKRYMDTCLCTERLSPKLIQVINEYKIFINLF
jgi:hypothetical protein